MTQSLLYGLLYTCLSYTDHREDKPPKLSDFSRFSTCHIDTEHDKILVSMASWYWAWRVVNEYGELLLSVASLAEYSNLLLSMASCYSIWEVVTEHGELSMSMESCYWAWQVIIEHGELLLSMTGFYWE